MLKRDYLYYKRELSKLNEQRKKFWKELRLLRNSVLSKYDPKNDAECLELYRLINDMWESTHKEDLRRQNKILPQRDELLGKSNDLEGLYKSDRLCVICSLPIEGNLRKIYCSEQCRQISKSRRYRIENPDGKMIANYRYLNSVLNEEEKG